MRDRDRVWLAVVVAAICGTIAGVSIYRSTKGPPARPPREPVAPDVKAFFDALTGIAPTSAETWPQADATVRESLSAQLRQLDARALPPTVALAETFASDLHAMLSGDFDAYVEQMRKQGVAIDKSEAQRGAWQVAAKMVNWTAIDAKAVAVRVYTLNGAKQPKPDGRKRLSTGTSRRKPGASKLPDSPDTGDLTILEVEIPMAIAVGPDLGERKPRLVQFRYAWHKELAVWSLWDIGTVLQPGDRSYMWPL